MVAESHATSVRRLLVASRDPDASALKMRLERVLSATDLAPSNVPPSAILCVRKLRDPLPGTLSIDRGEIRPSLRWAQAVNASLDQMVRRAARPAQGMVSADAEAVLFADHAEMLACLAGDWCEGAAFTRWWWRSLFRGTDYVNAIVDSWRGAPQDIPGTLHYLAINGKVVQFVRTVGVSDTWTVLDRMMTVFALSELRTALGTEAGRAREPVTRPIVVPEAVAEGIPQPSPWQRWVREGQGGGLGAGQQCLLGIGLMLHRAPVAVRAQPFAQAVAEWKSHRQRGQTQTLRERASERPGDIAQPEHTTLIPQIKKAVITTEVGILAMRGDSQSDSGTVSVSGTMTPTSLPVLPGAGERRGAGEAMGPDSIDATIRHDEQSTATSLPTPPAAAEQGDRSDGPSGSSQSESHVHEFGTELAPITEASVETAFGGLFYLMNLALYLNLYGDFSTPLQPGIALSPWDFLALAGDQLIGERIHDDPVWPLLAQLAGRDEGDLPGHGFHPPAEWRLQMMEQWGYDDRSAPDRFTDSPFIEWLMPFVRVRLMRALGLGREQALAKVLCEHPATVHVTATHVDVMLSLADLPMAVRLAGLDRDPGWVPAAGRYLAFHFA